MEKKLKEGKRSSAGASKTKDYVYTKQLKFLLKSTGHRETFDSLVTNENQSDDGHGEHSDESEIYGSINDNQDSIRDDET